MGWNGSGTFNRLFSWVADKAAAINITASRMDADTNDIVSNGLGNCLTRDGQGQPTAALPMAGFNHTGVGNATARTHYAAAGQIQDNGLLFATGGGTGDAITATFTPSIPALIDGMEVCVRAPGANTVAAPTFTPLGLTAHPITKLGGGSLLPGDIANSRHELRLRYNLANTCWELRNPAVTTSQFHGGCRLAFVSTTSIALNPHDGNHVKINGVLYALPSGGVTSANTNTFVSGVGSSNLAASTAYLVYLFNNGGTLALDFWPIAGGHVTDTSAGNVGVEVRSNSGTPDSTRTLVGAVLTNGSAQFQANSGAIIGVANWFNRRRFAVSSAYSASTSSTSVVALSGTALTYFQWADEELAFMSWLGTTSLTTTNGFITAIGFNTTQYLAVSPSQPVGGVPINSSFSGHSAGAGAEGFLNLNLIGQVGGGTGTWSGTLQAAARC